MFKRLAIATLAGAIGYAMGSAGGFFLVEWLSPNTHDRAVEAAMTGFLIAGPICGLIAFAVTFARAGCKPQRH